MLSERSEPSEVEDKRQKFIEALTSYRDDYSDEIPETAIASTSEDEDRDYKVRKGWWFSLIVRLHLLRQSGLLNQQLSRRTEEFSR